MALLRDTEHRFPEEPPQDHAMECERCGFVLPAWGEAKPYCPGMRQSRLESRSELRPVSPRRGRRRSSSVTGERIQYGEVCAWVRSLECIVARHPAHECRGGVQPHHLDRVGKGYGDWRVIDGRVVLRVVPACDAAHEELDGRLPNHDGVLQFEREYGIDPEGYAMAIQERCPVDPPEHYQLKAAGEIL